MSTAKRRFPERELERLEDLDEDEETLVAEKVEESFLRLDKRKAAVPVEDSFTELRGALEGATDDEGREGTEMLHAMRERDKRKDEKATRRLKSDE